MKLPFLCSLLFAVTLPLSAKEKDKGPVPPPPTHANIVYKTGDALSGYEKERCVLDLYLPKEKASGNGFATLVWFHGGGLTAGSKDGVEMKRIGASLAEEGIAVVVPNYRLSPKAKYPSYVDDAAAAVAWTLKNIAPHGGDTKRVFVGGHSAGGYLSLLLGMDARHLAKVGVKTTELAGLFPVSGQVMTHFSVRAERGLGKYSIEADDAAPARWVEAKGIPPMLVVWADKEMPTRGEENVLLVALLQAAKQKVTGIQVPNRDHGSVGHKIAEKGDPARVALLKFMHTGQL